MKATLILSTLMLFSTLSHAASLEALWARQEKETIQPVTVDGLSVAGSLRNAAKVCASLGYARLVNFETAVCERNKDKLVMFSTESNAVYVANDEHSEFDCLLAGELSKKLSAVTCAR